MVLWANQAQLRLLGLQADEYIGHHMTEFIVDPRPFAAAWAQLLSGATIHEFPVNLRCRDGAVKHVVIHCNGARGNGTLHHARCIVHDMTERLENELRKLELDQLAEADRQKDEFLAIVAHELRNPLAPIHLAVTLLRSRVGQGAPQRYLDTIERQAEALKRIVNDLLDVSRLLHGKLELLKEPVEVVGALANALETTRELMQQRQHTVTVVPEHAAYVLADPFRLEQILVNLLVNAAKYTEPGGHIFVSLKTTVEHVEISVRDTGIGIAPEMLEQIFDHFRQGEQGLDRAQGGLGLGLTIVQRLLQLHGGTIKAKSGGLGQGAEFIITLPTARADELGTEAGASRQQQIKRSLRILIVDDNVDAAEILAAILIEMGHKVVTAFDGPSALKIVQDFRPDLILLDIGLPGMDGYEVARRIRSMGCDARLVAVSGYTQPRDHQMSRDAGFAAHLGKPVELGALKEVLLAAASASYS